MLARLRVWALAGMVLLCCGSTPVPAPNLYDSEDLVPMNSRAQEAIQFRRKPILGAWWAEMPSIRVCASSGVSEARMNRALRYWRQLGYNIPNVWYDDGSAICRGDGIIGEIMISIVHNDIPVGNNLAVTRNHHLTRTRELIKSQIYVYPAMVDKELLIEHELGHALGWVHYNRGLHVMNENYGHIGHDSTGLTWREYTDERERSQERN